MLMQPFSLINYTTLRAALALSAFALLLAACGTSLPAVDPAVAATSAALPSMISAPDGVTMRLVAAGPFTMGIAIPTSQRECRQWSPNFDCDIETFAHEEKPHTVTLGDFYIDEYEVTNRQYAACVAAKVCAAPPEEPSFHTTLYQNYYRDPQYANYPLVNSTWDEASAYCAWRGARLPSEAEWEKTARGVDGRIYPWGNEFAGQWANICDKSCQYSQSNPAFDDGYWYPAPVGSYPTGASPYGILDLAGNVSEWVADWYDPASPIHKIVRGGSWNDRAYTVRTSYRATWMPDTRSTSFGFRCAQTL
jgi:formylglycine-generating enzyme required for sulfatase activity